VVDVISRTTFSESPRMPKPADMKPPYMSDIFVVIWLWIRASAVSWMRESFD